MTATGYPMSSVEGHYGTVSQSPPRSSAQPGNGVQHQRTYQACIPCRQRKVRCDLGSVDNPHDPPCTRCRRESKECYFSATRRKKKTGNESNDAEVGDEVYEIRGGNRKRLRASIPEYEEPVEEEYVERPRTPGGSVGRTVPLRRPTGPKPVQYGEEDEKASEHTAAFLQHAELHGGHDALKVLYQAAVSKAGRSDSMTSSGTRPATGMNGFTSASLPSAASPIVEKLPGTSYTNGPMSVIQNDPLWKVQTGQAHQNEGLVDAIPIDNATYAAATKAWSRFKFVRAGWFTAKEGMDYILYFYKYLAPLTPVALRDFRHPSTHKTLLEDEPMLAVTMLLVASRHMKLDGPGAQSRPYAIHQKTWDYLSGMIDRLVWGQEQFGGGFCGAGAQPSCDVNPLTRKGLRTLGTVESLVLLTEWHPRAMHFPPTEDDDDLMLPDYSLNTPDSSEDVPRGIGGHRMDAWLEPCWRSDRLCWMLLGMAMSLAMEIGVFDSSEWQRHARSSDGGPLSAEDLTTYDKRRLNVRDLLLVYVTQTSGRLGLTSMLPGYYSKPEESDLFRRQLGQQDSVQDITLHFWLRMAALMRDGNTKIFPNKTFTRDLIRNGNYKAALEQFQKPLNDWQREFDDCKVIPKYMKCILRIEFEYCRVYLNALGLQAVAERCANDQPSPIDPPLEMARAAVASSNSDGQPVAIAPATLSKWLGGDRHYMQNVGDAARNLLKVVVEELNTDGYLRHAPVRTYFRIISVAIMLFKSFSLGATESDVTDSLNLMDRTVEALRTCIVDDVHVASRFADLLDTLSRNLKPRLVRIAADGRATKSRRVGHHHEYAQQANLTPMSNQSTHARYDSQASAGAVPHQQQQWGYNNMVSPSTVAGDNPMYGINNETFDPMGANNTYSVMPPPGFSTHSPNTQNATNMSTGTPNGYDAFSSGSFNEQQAQDWYALPLDPILNMSGADVTNSMYGPDIGGQDMLELLLQGNQNF
ncbi:hypothetical protein PRZ48_003680 [Zasmidium cellare]|uniref:Zn(2)-C6 fungal-type domain-containing protein n=1 Tax=Zasmidium cellare TaxID=395010 RepID=A0ABR0EWA4_ZASCE|nr:hypothetical protein PRZ48_003680 [Zasmidium cellare]